MFVGTGLESSAAAQHPASPVHGKTQEEHAKGTTTPRKRKLKQTLATTKYRKRKKEDQMKAVINDLAAGTSEQLEEMSRSAHFSLASELGDCNGVVKCLVKVDSCGTQVY